MTQPVDISILHEIVRIIESRGKVPLKVIVKSKEYVLTYLEDHQRRLEEALQRFDRDRLNMLYGQLASKIKYQLLRRVPARGAAAAPVKKSAASARPAAAKSAARPTAKSTKSATKSAKKAVAAKRKPAAKRPGTKVKKAAARKPAARKRR